MKTVLDGIHEDADGPIDDREHRREPRGLRDEHTPEHEQEAKQGNEDQEDGKARRRP